MFILSSNMQFIKSHNLKWWLSPSTLLFINVSLKCYSDSGTEQNGGWQAVSGQMLRLTQFKILKLKVKVTQSCLTLLLEWVAFPFSRGSSQPRDQTQVSHIAGGFFTSWKLKRLSTKIMLA